MLQHALGADPGRRVQQIGNLCRSLAVPKGPAAGRCQGDLPAGKLGQTALKEARNIVVAQPGFRWPISRGVDGICVIAATGSALRLFGHIKSKRYAKARVLNWVHPGPNGATGGGAPSGKYYL
ncbi:MAG: hypothetical protein OEN23_06695 [Paracoccaceae bacterium]|nr:hypothetical protein [Paracoccaceae bacterium]